MSNNTQGGNPLNKPIGGTKKGKYPDKEVINFIKHEKKSSDGKALAIFALFMAALLVFIYFGVIKQLQRIDEAEMQFRQAQDELNELKEQNEAMADIEEEYNSRVEMYYTDEELEYSNRKEIIDMLNDDVVPYLDNITVNVSADNEISITANQADFVTVSTVLSNLQNDNRIYTAKVMTSDQQNDDETSGKTYTVDATYKIVWNTEDTSESEVN